MKKVPVLLVSLLLIFFLFISGISLAAPQGQGTPPPINLSRSGAASQPQIIVLPDGTVQVYWWDQFDGLVSVFSRDQVNWSEPILEDIPGSDIQKMPLLISDGFSAVHAFWLESKTSINNPEAATVSLLHSQLLFGQAIWSYAEKLADSVSAMDVISPSPGVLQLVFLRTKNLPQESAGIYFIKKLPEGAGWTKAFPIYTSIYLRSLNAEQADLSIISAAGADLREISFVTWQDPQSKKTQMVFSVDQGNSWSAPEILEAKTSNLTSPRVISIPRASLVWQSLSQDGCAFYQQNLDISGASQAEDMLEFGNLTSMMDGLSLCPQGGLFFEKDGRTYWVWGTASTLVLVSAYDASVNAWSIPYRLSVPIKNPVTEQITYLNDLKFELAGDQIIIVGVDEANQDVWLVEIWVPGLLLAYANPSPWGDLQSLEVKGVVEEPPVINLDPMGRIWAVWSQAPSSQRVGNELRFVQENSAGGFETVEIVSASRDEIARHPALFFELGRNLIHFVWSGGENGVLLYRWVAADKAGDPDAWSAPKTISSLYDSAHPQIAADLAGNLYVLFVVPLNQSRAVYLVHSSDGGESWSKPRIVFDAAKAQYDMVDQPTLAVAPDQSLHAAWVHAKTPGLGGSIAIEYAQSTDFGQTWTAPQVLSGQGFSRPRLAFTGEVLHLIFTPDEGGSSGIYHRYVSSGEMARQTSAWSVPVAIPGWQQVSPKYGLASGSKLYLVGADPTLGKLNFSTWDGERWTAEEGYDNSLQVSRGVGVSVAVNEENGELAVSWLAVLAGEDVTNPVVLLLRRQVPAVQDSDLPISAILVSATPEAIPSQTPAFLPTLPPSPTPDLNRPASNRSLPLPPMVLGGGLAALLIILAFSIYLFLKRGR